MERIEMMLLSWLPLSDEICLEPLHSSLDLHSDEMGFLFPCEHSTFLYDICPMRGGRSFH